MTLNDFMKLTQSIKNRMFMMLARGIVKAVRNTEGTQKLQIVALADETIDNIERLQEYGLETYPDADAEAFAAFVGGNREIGVVLVTHDRRYRPKTLASGEVMVYTKFGQSIHLKADGSIVLSESGGVKATLSAGVITLEAGTVNVGATGGKTVALQSIMDLFNNHTHSYLPGPGAATPTAPPLVPFTAADFSTKAKAV